MINTTKGLRGVAQGMIARAQIKFQNEAEWRDLGERAGYIVTWEPIKQNGK